MTLNEIKKKLSESRSNGVYFRDTEWPVDGGTSSGLAYMSKGGNLYMTYLHPIKQVRLVVPFSSDMENMARPKSTFAIWEGNV